MNSIKKIVSILRVLLGGIGLLTISCGKNSSPSISKSIIVSNNTDYLDTRLKILNEKLTIEDLATDQTNLKPKETNFTLTLVGELASPEISATPLQATDTYISGNLAFVAYNIQGETQMGGIEIIDISDKSKPQIKSQILFNDRDINAIAYRNNKVYAVGALQNPGAGKDPAFLSEITLEKKLFTGEVVDYPLPSYAGTDVEVNSKYILATSGDDGGVTIFDRQTMEQMQQVDIFDARAVSQFGSSADIHVLSGQPGVVRHYDSKGESLGNDWTLEGANIAQSKSTILSGSRWTIASIGDGGWKILCNDNGEFIHHQKAVDLTSNGISTELTVTNAVTSYLGLLFAANGEAGIYAYQLENKTGRNSCDDLEVTELGSINFGSNLSSNHVYAKTQFVFVADGLGGFKILTHDKEADEKDCIDFDDDDGDDEAKNDDDYTDE